VVQINPGTVSGSTKEIRRGVWDRRNQLAGNPSLNQELGFVDDINGRVAGGHGSSFRW